MDDEEELSDAVQYLHHQGTLLHFTDQALKFVYFLDPQWLCRLMASVIRVPPAGKESLVKNGMCHIGRPVRTTITLYPIGRSVRATITLYPIGRPIRATITLYAIGRPVRAMYYYTVSYRDTC